MNENKIYQAVHIELTGDQFGMKGTTNKEIIGTFGSEESANKAIEEYLKQWPGISKHSCWVQSIEVKK